MTREWVIDKYGRWRSPRWRRWVRSLSCACGELFCELCNGTGVARIEAAHFRYPGCGMGLKPEPAASLERIYVPERTKQTEMLEGSAAEVAAKLVEKLKFDVRIL